MAKELELAELIGGLRKELELAQTQAAGAEVHFEVGPVELEVTVAAQKKGTGKAEIKFWVVTAEAGGELSATTTQRIKLTLKPVTGGDGATPVMVEDHAQRDER
jgi:hypothetical protein